MSTSSISFKPIPEPTRKIRVNPGQSIHNAITNLKEGEAIELETGGTYLERISIHQHNSNKPFQIISSNLGLLPKVGERFDPIKHVAAKVHTPSNSIPALDTQPGAHNWIISGIEFGASGGKTIDELIKLGRGNSEQSTLESVPHNLLLDRCYVRGQKSSLTSKRGIALNSSKTTIQNCYISDFHGNGFDTQAICGWNGPGDYDILNNYIEGAGENVMIGGAQTFISGLVPTNINFFWNDFVKPLSWRVGDPSYDGVRRSVKNSFELKTGRKVRIEGNRFKNCWVDGQTGVAIVLKSSNQGSGQTWSITEEVEFINNIVEGAAGGVHIIGRDDPDIEKTNRIKVANTLFLDINGPKWGSAGMGRLFQAIGGPKDIVIDHCTGFQSNHILVLDGEPSTGLQYTNNITPHNEYGIFGSGEGTGKSALDYFYPGNDVRRNILVGGSPRVYPSDNQFPNAMNGIEFINFANGDFRLAPTSPYRNFGTDGKDLGVDFAQLAQAFELPVSTPPINSDLQRLIELHREMGEIITRL